jgi:serine/threonine-protein kinase
VPDTDLSVPSDLIIGGKYQVVDTLGVGGSGTVYKAHPVGMTRMVAVKLMHASHADADSERLRFAREAEVVKRLQHPHIVGLIDYGHHEDAVPYLVQPLLEGETLEAKLAREHALSWDATAKLSVHVLRALEKAHGMEIAHRDIKPANIFVSRGVLGEMAQVLDFGLAKVVRGDLENELAVTRVGAVLGTPRYMAPEQARGEEVGQCADIYAFGLVMAEMLIGEPLISGKNDVEIYAMQGSDRPLRLPPQLLQSPFASVLQRALAKPLDIRYRLASQMLADVRAVSEKLGGGDAMPAEADMDATQMLDPAMAVALSTPNATSEKLRDVFNVLATKRAASEALEGRADVSPPSERTAPFATPTAPTPAAVSPSAAANAEPTAVYDMSALQPHGPPAAAPLAAAPFAAAPPAAALFAAAPFAAAPPAAAPPPAFGQLPPPTGAQPVAPTVSDPALAWAPGGAALAAIHAATLPSTAPRPRNTGLWIALVVVLLLTVAATVILVWLLTSGG